jgi:uncharacterized protein (TIGR01370 family)
LGNEPIHKQHKELNMSSTTIPYLYQLQGLNYSSLSSIDFKIAVVDSDDSELTTTQISGLEATGKTVYAYLALGKDEPWRDYSNPNASYILGLDQQWGSHYVKFWDPVWQDIIINRAVTMAEQGYGGIVMDVMDTYNIALVSNADGGTAKARNDMMKFVTAISNAAKAINPDFQIIQNNCLDLLVTNQADPTSATNTEYISHIDGLNTESVFFLSDNTAPSWGAWNMQYLQHMVSAGKVVFDIDYPTSTTAQQAFITQAIANGFIPFVGNTLLSEIDPINHQIMSQLTPAELAFMNIGSTPVPTPTPTPDPTIPTTSSGVTSSTASNGDHVMNGTSGADVIVGVNTRDLIYAGDGNDTIYAKDGINYVEGGAGDDIIYGGANADYIFGGNGNDTLIGGAGNDGLTGGAGNDKFAFFKGSGNDYLNDFQGAGSTVGDIIQIASDIYSTAAIALSNVTYSGGNALIKLDGANTVTLAGVAANSLIAADFQIIDPSGVPVVTTPTPDPTPTSGLSGTTLISGVQYNIYNVSTGNNSLNTTVAYEDFVFGANYHGQTTIKYFSHDAHSLISLDSSLYSTAAQALSNVTYSGSDAIIHLTGTDTIKILGAGANSLVASDFNIYDNVANLINGTTGNDTLTGTAQNNTIYGLDGNDKITGGLGADLLKGGLGSDSFNFSNLADSKNGSYDTISDFTVGQDKIDLHLLNTFGIDTFTDLTITNDVAHNETIITANDTTHPGATDHFELHLNGVVTLHDGDFVWG